MLIMVEKMKVMMMESVVSQSSVSCKGDVVCDDVCDGVCDVVCDVGV